MDIYKEASRIKLRVDSSRGPLTVDQLWDLSLQELDKLAVALEEEYKKSGKKSFLVQKSAKDKVLKLKFDIVVDVLTSKVEENDTILNEREKKAHNEKILEIIAKKQDQELEGLSVNELKKKLK